MCERPSNSSPTFRSFRSLFFVVGTRFVVCVSIIDGRKLAANSTLNGWIEWPQHSVCSSSTMRKFKRIRCIVYRFFSLLLASFGQRENTNEPSWRWSNRTTSFALLMWFHGHRIAMQPHNIVRDGKIVCVPRNAVWCVRCDKTRWKFAM